MELKLTIGLIAGVLTSIAALPQIIKVIKEKDAQNVAPFMYLVLLAGNATWCYYGFLLKDIPIMATNAFSVILDITMLILNYKYTKVP